MQCCSSVVLMLISGSDVCSVQFIRVFSLQRIQQQQNRLIDSKSAYN